MIPAAFDYVRAGSADEAVSLIAEHGEDAKFLAGGHSLLPLMKLRLAQPAVLVDIGRLSDLSYVRDAGDHIAIGAAPAVINAIVDALSDIGVTDIAMPASPQRVWAAINTARSGGHA